MLLIKTKVAPSAIHGLGLFADQPIPKGTKIWEFTPLFDQKFTQEQIDALPELIQDYLYTYSWLSKKTQKRILTADDAKYFNHSDNPNCLSEYQDNEEEVITIAQRDIHPNEELTDNYDSFE